MILITSASYISSDLISEFGKLPPCMLPLQNKRLYQHQISLFKNDETIVLSLPIDYDIAMYDLQILNENNVKVVKVPNKLSLGESIVYCLNFVANYNEPLRILHGDTLIDKIPDGYDICSISTAEDDYSWSYVSNKGKYVYAGYFSFSNQSLLISKITSNGYKFIDGIEEYNKSIKLENEKTKYWLDFGLSNSYYRSKSKFTTQRVFNDIQINSYSVIKCSKDSDKILAEAEWFSKVPKEIKRFTPALWDKGIKDNKGFYEIEYFYLSSLAELYVFGENPTFVWKEIINSCIEFISTEYKFKPIDINQIQKQNKNLYGDKTYKRLNLYVLQHNISLDRKWILNNIETPSLREIIEETNTIICMDNNKYVSIMHGDFCFSNILYNFQNQSIKVIDPRGIDLNSDQTIYGDIRYDVAKMSHSIIGMYDFIIGGRFEFNQIDEYNIEFYLPIDKKILEIQEYFKSLKIAGNKIQYFSIYPIMIHLFLSMIPLHSDNEFRQKAMLANALRLYIEYKSI